MFANTHRYSIFLLILFVLIGCSKSLNIEIQNSFSEAQQAMEIKVGTSEYLLLYGNEKQQTSYLVSISMSQSGNLQYEDTIELADYYTTIDQNPNQFQQLVLNTAKKNKSLTITLDDTNTVRNRVLKLEQANEYINSDNTLKEEIVDGKVVMKDRWLGSQYSFYFNFDLEKEYQSQDETIKFMDMTAIDAVINE